MTDEYEFFIERRADGRLDVRMSQATIAFAVVDTLAEARARAHAFNPTASIHLGPGVGMAEGEPDQSRVEDVPPRNE